jgi:hypothetical protein
MYVRRKEINMEWWANAGGKPRPVRIRSTEVTTSARMIETGGCPRKRGML